MPAFTDLNHDVLLVLLSFLSYPPHALSLMQTCRTLHEIVLPILLREVCLDNPLRIAHFYGIRTVVPFTAFRPESSPSSSFISTASYAQRVRDLEMGLYDEPYDVLEPDIWTQMADILCDCSNLSTLSLDGTERVFEALVKRDVQLPRLISLSLSNFNSDEPGLSSFALEWLGGLQAPLSAVTLWSLDECLARQIFNALATFTGTLKSLWLSNAQIPLNVGELPSWPAVQQLSLCDCFVCVSTLELAFPNVDRLEVYEEDFHSDYEEMRALNLAHRCLKWLTLSYVKGNISALDLYVLQGCRVDYLELSSLTGFYFADTNADTLRNIQPKSLSLQLRLNDDNKLEHLSAVPGLARLQLWLYPSKPGEMAVFEFIGDLSRLYERLKGLGALRELLLSVEYAGKGLPSLSTAEQLGYMGKLLKNMSLQSVELEWPAVGWDKRVAFRADV